MNTVTKRSNSVYYILGIFIIGLILLFTNITSDNYINIPISEVTSELEKEKFKNFFLSISIKEEKLNRYEELIRKRDLLGLNIEETVEFCILEHFIDGESSSECNSVIVEIIDEISKDNEKYKNLIYISLLNPSLYNNADFLSDCYKALANYLYKLETYQKHVEGKRNNDTMDKEMIILNYRIRLTLLCLYSIFDSELPYTYILSEDADEYKLSTIKDILKKLNSKVAQKKLKGKSNKKTSDEINSLENTSCLLIEALYKFNLNMTKQYNWNPILVKEIEKNEYLFYLNSIQNRWLQKIN